MNYYSSPKDPTRISQQHDLSDKDFGDEMQRKTVRKINKRIENNSTE